MLNKKDIMKLEGLVYFLAVTQHKSKRQAAEVLGISIDTLSKYIEYLETELGIKLLVNTGRGSILTAEANRILEESDKLKNIIKQIDVYALEKKEVAGKVTIFTQSYWLAAALAMPGCNSLLEKFPKLQLDIRSNDSMSTIEADISITYSIPNNVELCVIATKEMALEFACSKDYALKYGIPTSFEDMCENHRFCNLISSEQYIYNYKQLKNKMKNIVLTTNSTQAINQAIDIGIAIGLLYKGDAKRKGLIPINIDFSEKLTCYVVTHKDIKNSPKIKEVLNLINTNLATIENQ